MKRKRKNIERNVANTKYRRMEPREQMTVEERSSRENWKALTEKRRPGKIGSIRIEVKTSTARNPYRPSRSVRAIYCTLIFSEAYASNLSVFFFSQRLKIAIPINLRAGNHLYRPGKLCHDECRPNLRVQLTSDISDHEVTAIIFMTNAFWKYIWQLSKYLLLMYHVAQNRIEACVSEKKNVWTILKTSLEAEQWIWVHWKRLGLIASKFTWCWQYSAKQLGAEVSKNRCTFEIRTTAKNHRNLYFSFCSVPKNTYSLDVLRILQKLSRAIT